MRAGVDCVAVTDHNSGEWIDRLKEALCELKQEDHPDFRPLTLFPGVEITANGNTHVLALLDLNCGPTDVAALLGAVGYEGTRGASDLAANCSPIEVVKAICEAGGVPILAHVDGPAGAWKLSGNTLAPLLDADELFALEVVDPSHEKPPLYKDRKLNWAEVVGSDSHHPSGADGSRFPGSHYTWIKMASPSLKGLRLALLDGDDFSIRRSDTADLFDPFVVPKNLVEAIEIEDARYMGLGSAARIEFSPWLNALVGGRGTGKSTIVHALRLAARRGPELNDLEERTGPRLTFQEFDREPKDRRDRGGLRANTAIRWLVQRDEVRHRVHWRQKASGVVVEYCAKDTWKESPWQTVTPQRFPIRLFSQGQIAELAGKNQALLRVIDEAAQVAPQQRELDEACAAFNALRGQIRETDQRLTHEEALVVELQDVERKLKRFEDAGHQVVLTEYRRRERQEQEVLRQFELAKEAADLVDGAAEKLALYDLPEGVFSANGEDGRAVAILAKIDAAVRAAADNLRNQAGYLRQSIKEQRDELAKSAWQAAVDKTGRDYQELVQALKNEGVADPSEYGKLIQDRALVVSDQTRMESLREERDRLIEKSKEQLHIILKARQAISAARAGFLCDVLAHNDFVRIGIRAYGDEPSVVERSLRERLDIMDDRFQDDILSEDGERGVVADLMNGLPDDAGRSAEFERRIDHLKGRVKNACTGNGNFRGRFNNYLLREFEKKPELLDKALTWFPEDSLTVEYSPGGDGTGFRPIHQASAGQRSAAMLAFLLAHGEEPLVLDQPEDDLDNHLIYDLVVRQIRENKLRRQIIVVTHNPNIVVNGDAELVHALRFTNGQCVVAESGSLQDASIREEVCQIMEGGREAFVRRYRRLGREPGRV